MVATKQACLDFAAEIEKLKSFANEQSKPGAPDRAKFAEWSLKLDQLLAEVEKESANHGR